MENNKKRILIVEDDNELAQWISDFLQSNNYDCAISGNGLEARKIICNDSPDLVILDGMLPGLDGVDVCREVRKTFSNPIIMLTARDEEIDEVIGLEVGADDYLVKPVRAHALLARINKALDGQHRAEKENALVFGELKISASSQSVFLGATEINVTSKEFEVLWLLASNAGNVVTREEMIENLRGFEFDGFDRSIDLRVSRLRKKLRGGRVDEPGIKTIWGKGYLFVKEAWL